MKITTPNDLDALIAGAIGESTSLEYKAADAIRKKDDIGIDVSSMANASGGTIVYGMFCVDNKPAAIDPIKDYRQETLEQVIASQTRPPVPCHIHPIEHENGMVLIVDIEASQTAHQAKFDCRYHRRRDTTTYWMEDYEIRDVMNRPRHPKVALEFSIKHGKLIPYFFNHGRVFAKHVRCILEVPKFFIADSQGFESRDADGTVYLNIEHTNKDRGVVHPEAGITLNSLTLNPTISTSLYLQLDKSKDRPRIRWTLWADNADIAEGSVDIKKITIQDLHSYDP